MKKLLIAGVTLFVSTGAAYAQQQYVQPQQQYVTTEVVETKIVDPGFPTYIPPTPNFYNDHARGTNGDQYDWSYWQQDSGKAK